MNRFFASRAAPLKSTQWASQVRYNSTEATKKMIKYNHPTAPLSAFNQRLANQFRHRNGPKQLLTNVLKIVKEIKEQNLRLDHNTYNAILAAYARNKDRTSVLSTLQEMKENGLEPSIDTYNTVLEGFANTGDVRSQLELKKEMLEKGKELTLSSYYHLLRGLCKAKKLDAALATFKEMKEQPNIESNLNIYATIINACVDLSRSDTAFGLLKEAEQLGLPVESQPRVYLDVMRAGSFNDDMEVVEYCWEKAIGTYSMRPDEGTMLDVLRVAAKKGNTQLATDTIRQLSTNGYPYKEHYFTPLMEAFIVKEDLKSAFNVLDIMRVSGVPPTMRATLPILKALNNNVDAIDKAYYILEEMKKEKKTVDITAFNVVVEACANARDLERTIATYREAGQLGVVPNVDTYNAVLEACVKTGMKSMGNVVIEEMKKADISPNLNTYSKMISLSCTQKNYEDAFTYLEEMKSYDIVPPESCYISLAQKLSYEKDPRFHMVLEEMETFGYRIPQKIRESWKSRHYQN